MENATRILIKKKFSIMSIYIILILASAGILAWTIFDSRSKASIRELSPRFELIKSIIKRVNTLLIAGLSLPFLQNSPVILQSLPDVLQIVLENFDTVYAQIGSIIAVVLLIFDQFKGVQNETIAQIMRIKYNTVTVAKGNEESKNIVKYTISKLGS